MKVLDFEAKFRLTGTRCPNCGLEFSFSDGIVFLPNKYSPETSKIVITWPANNKCDACGSTVLDEETLIELLKEKIDILHSSDIEVVKRN